MSLNILIRKPTAREIEVLAHPEDDFYVEATLEHGGCTVPYLGRLTYCARDEEGRGIVEMNRHYRGGWILDGTLERGMMEKLYPELKKEAGDHEQAIP